MTTVEQASVARQVELLADFTRALRYYEKESDYGAMCGVLLDLERRLPALRQAIHEAREGELMAEGARWESSLPSSEGF